MVVAIAPVKRERDRVPRPVSILKWRSARERQRFGVAGDNSAGSFIKTQESRALLSATVVPMTTPCAGNRKLGLFRVSTLAGILWLGRRCRSWLRFFRLGFFFRWFGFRRFWSRGSTGSLRHF